MSLPWQGRRKRAVRLRSRPPVRPATSADGWSKTKSECAVDLGRVAEQKCLRASCVTTMTSLQRARKHRREAGQSAGPLT